MDHYFTIEKPSFAEFKDRGSSFQAYAFPMAAADEFKKKLKEIKAAHPKAAHHCFAYRLDEYQFRAGDDGEPPGSAGKPILGQIDSRQLRKVGIVVVRYFGGTLLGVPGLINAYKTAASLSLQLTPIIQKPVLEQYELQFDYTLMNEVMMVMKRFGCLVFENESLLFCRMRIGVPRQSHALCLEKLSELHGVALKKSEG